VICFAPSLSDSIIFLTLTRLVVVIKFVNFRFALFTPPLGDFQLPRRSGAAGVPSCVRSVWAEASRMRRGGGALRDAPRGTLAFGRQSSRLVGLRHLPGVP
jgi:hypothetical protein